MLVYIGLYVLFGLPLALATALTNSEAAIIRRVLMAFVMLPIWPVWSLWAAVLYMRRLKIIKVCAWCGALMPTLQSARIHAIKCPNHPWLEHLQSVGFDVHHHDDGRIGITDGHRIYLPEKR